VEAGRGVPASPEVRRTFVRAFLLPSWVLLAAVALPFALGVEVTGWVQYAPFALSLILFGLASLWFAPDHGQHAAHDPATVPNDTDQVELHRHHQ